MKFYILFTFIATSILSIGQIKSYDFSSPIAVNGLEVETVSKSYFGEYENDEKRYTVNEKGIFFTNNIYLSIKKETVRENSKYFVKGNYLFGIVKDDSVYYFEQDNRYYYGFRETTAIVDKFSLNKLIDNGSEYFVNFYEQGNYVPTLFRFSHNKLEILEFDYDSNTEVFNHIRLRTNKIENSVNFITLFPTEKEWKAIDLKVIFPEMISYTKK